MAIINRLPMNFEKKPISEAIITYVPLTYNGLRQCPVWTVTYNGETLVENVDYTITNAGAKDASSSATSGLTNYTETFTGIGRFEGSKTSSFTIERRENKSLSLGTITWSGLPTEIASSYSSAPYNQVKCTITQTGRYGYALESKRTAVSNVQTGFSSITTSATSVTRPYKVARSRTSVSTASWSGYFIAYFRSQNEYRSVNSQTISLTYP